MYEQTEIPEYLKKKIDANHAEPNCYLKINELCLATFREGTNLQEIAVPHKAEYRAQQRGIVDKEEIKAIARDILTQQNQLNNLMTQYINTVFTAPKHKLNEPFVYLKYKSADIELKTKTLVMYPKIVSEKLFNDYQKFLQNNGLKDCGVDMSKNNLVFDAVQTGINHFMRQEKRGPPENKRRNIETHIMERYWSTVPNREVKRLAELSVDEFCEISNFRELVIETINENNLAIPLKSSLLCFFDIFKNQPEKRDNEMFSKLKFDARYIVVLNILSPEEEEALASSFVKFQRNSNINELLQNKCTEKNCKEWFLIYKLKPEERKKLIFKDLVYYKISPSISRPNVKVESKTKSSSVNTISNTLKRKSTMDFTNDQKRLRLKSAQRSYSSINSTKPVNLNSPVEAQTKSSCVTPDIDKLGRNRFSISSNCSSSTVDSVIELAKLPTGQQQTDPEDSVDVTKLSCLLCRTSNVESILREQYYMNNITGTEENWLASKDCVMHDFVCNLIMGLFFSLDQITFNNEQHKQNFLQELEKLNEDSVTETPNLTIDLTVKAEQSTQDVEIDSQSDTVYLISDDSSLEDEVSTELSRIHNVEDRVDTKDVIKDSENTTTSQDYEVICQKRVLNRSHMNRDSFISKVSTMITSGRSPEALKSILPLPSRPRKTSGRLWSRIKVNQVGTSHQDFYDDDSSEDSTKDGKANDEPTVNDDKNVEEILNNDLSVFLSSQLTRLVDQEWRKTSEVAIKKARKLIESNFTYAKPIVRVNDGPHDNAKGCFYSRLVSLKVNNAGKAKGWFHLYQYNLWNVPMDHGQLQVMFNLKNEEWTALEEAFTMLPNYEFSSINKVDRETHQLSTLQDMDLYLKSISQVNSCYITFKDGEPDQCFATHNPAKKIDNTKAIDPYILETMRTKDI